MSSSFTVYGNGWHSDRDTPSWQERLRGLRYIPPFLRLVWRSHRGYTAGVIVLRMLRSLVPLATLWVGKLIIDEVITITSSPRELSTLWGYVVLEIGIVLLGSLLARLSTLLESLLGDLCSIHISIRIMKHAADLDLEQFEDPRFHDHLERARRQMAGRRIALVSQLLAVGQDLLTFLTLGVALVSYSVWLGLLLVLSVLPGFWGETHFAALEYSLLFRYTPERRKLNYLRALASSERTAKEVQMLGLSSWLSERYRFLADQFYDANKRLAVRKSILGWLLSLVGMGGYYVAYVLIVLATVSGSISVGRMTFLTGSFARARTLVRNLLLAASEIYEQSLYLRDLFIFLELRPRVVSQPGARPVPQPVQRGFVFEDVGFRYPGSQRWAVRHLNFALPPGTCLALVGENGAGKTTLTKLLARLYDPIEGRIMLDGVDLREYDKESLRSAVGVLFQDFVRYDLRFDENIGVGQIERVRAYLDAEAAIPPDILRDRGKATPAIIREAAAKSLATDLLSRCPDGFRQMLGRSFEGGLELSGGEWQKIGLARAYIRDAQVFILDEPTASLDARAEYEIFRRFRTMMAGCMSVVISHRFSTVRIADHIIVLADGRLVEDGTHELLLRQRGLYAELFEMQAAAYH